VFTHFRLRFDAAFDNPIPDRAEFFYAKCGCFARIPAEIWYEDIFRFEYRRAF
jgi:hypothetical protein